MKKTVFTIALLVGIALSVSTYANLQDKKTETKTETVQQNDKNKDASTSDMKKDDASCKKHSKDCAKPCCKKETKECK